MSETPLRKLIADAAQIVMDGAPSDTWPEIEDLDDREASEAYSYLLGMADAFDVTVLELLDEYGVNVNLPE